mgnify:CR=1 FL=1
MIMFNDVQWNMNNQRRVIRKYLLHRNITKMIFKATFHGTWDVQGIRIRYFDNDSEVTIPAEVDRVPCINGRSISLDDPIPRLSHSNAKHSMVNLIIEYIFEGNILIKDNLPTDICFRWNVVDDVIDIDASKYKLVLQDPIKYTLPPRITIPRRTSSHD